LRASPLKITRFDMQIMDMLRRSGLLRGQGMAAACVSLMIAVLAAPLMASAASEAQPVPAVENIPAPRDIPYPGVIQLSVDVTDVDHRIFKAHETLPVTGAGDLVLLFPQWIPGEHAPTGDLPAFAGLLIHSGQTLLAWTRDPLNVFAFHVHVPKGSTRLDLDYQYLSATKDDIGTVFVAHGQLMLDWQDVVLYPAGYFARDIQVQPRLTVPKDWQVASALDPESTSGAVTTFQTIPLEVLVDSPVETGRYLKRYPLTDSGQVPVYLDVMAEQAALTELKPEIVAQHRALVQQAFSLFGSHHFNHYDFLYSLNDELGFGVTVEHQRSGEYALESDEFTDWDSHVARRDDLAHEFTHSWDGKFRRPADLWIPNFNVPMRNDLLWVYEGGTQYWGLILTARSGLWSKEQALEAWASWVASLTNMPGRSWRDLQDTTNEEIINPRRPMSWYSWERFEDYYGEGALIWLDADTLIRQRSGGKRSLDDFARGFFGVEDGRWTALTYTFEDVVKALNAVEPYDWAAFLRQLLDRRGAEAPLDGLTRGGYRLVYTDTPTEHQKAAAAAGKRDDFYYSLGFMLDKEGAIGAELWDSPAFKAGLIGGTRIVAVNNVAYEAKKLTEAIKAAQNSTAPIELLVRSGDLFQTVRIDYHGGLRYPHLEQIPGAPALFDDILAPRP
jgi:predicted metalloprotease with PDZ domain